MNLCSQLVNFIHECYVQLWFYQMKARGINGELFHTALRLCVLSILCPHMFHILKFMWSCEIVGHTISRLSGDEPLCRICRSCCGEIARELSVSSYFYITSDQVRISTKCVCFESYLLFTLPMLSALTDTIAFFCDVSHTVHHEQKK